MSALSLRIDYRSPRREHCMWPRRGCSGDWWFRTSKDQGVEERETTNLSPFSVREAFESVKTAEEAVRFLSDCGRFWPFDGVLWSQFREWQSFFKWLRLGPTEGKKAPEGQKAWDTAQGINSFFSETDSQFSRSRFGRAPVVEKIGPELWNEVEIEDQLTLNNLRHFAIHPYRAVEVEGFEGSQTKSQITLHWHDPGNLQAPEGNRESLFQTAPLDSKPYLRIEASNIIEAIAATIYADRMEGLRYGQCKKCHRLFKVESDHGQQFCPPPSHLKTSPCKNAFLQRERRSNERRGVELIVASWSKGLRKKEIAMAAEIDGIRLNQSIWEKARRKPRRS